MPQTISAFCPSCALGHPVPGVPAAGEDATCPFCGYVACVVDADVAITVRTQPIMPLAAYVPPNGMQTPAALAEAKDQLAAERAARATLEQARAAQVSAVYAVVAHAEALTGAAKEALAADCTALRAACGFTDVAPLSYRDASLPEGRVGVPYLAQLVVEGGLAPLTFRLAGLKDEGVTAEAGAEAGAEACALAGVDPKPAAGRALPDGLDLLPDGTLKGAPTVAGEFPLVVTVTDSLKPRQTLALKLTLTVKE